MEEAHDAAALVMLRLVVVAPAAHAARAGDRSARVVLLGVAVVAHLKVADELLGLAGVLVAVAALPELLGRRLDAALCVRHGAGALARGLPGGAPFGLALLRPLTI